MGTIRKVIIDAALGSLVVAFILFWILAGVGLQHISFYAAFLVYVSATVLLLAVPMATDKEYCQYLKHGKKNSDQDEPLVIDLEIDVRPRNMK